MSEDPVLALFDIDGTILKSGVGARKSLSQAIEEIIEQPFKIEPEHCAGKTDPLIIANFLEEAGCLMQELQQLITMVKKRYLELLVVNYNKNKDAYLYPGVPELLENISEYTHVHLALLTGNFEKGARVKLEPFFLNPLFPVGAFGDDGFLRTDLSHVAVKRAEKYYQTNYKPENIVVIGDTADDVKCGKVIDARTICIVRRKTTMEKVRQMKPDHIFEDTENTDEFVKAILSS